MLSLNLPFSLKFYVEWFAVSLTGKCSQT